MHYAVVYYLFPVYWSNQNRARHSCRSGCRFWGLMSIVSLVLPLDLQFSSCQQLRISTLFASSVHNEGYMQMLSDPVTLEKFQFLTLGWNLSTQVDYERCLVSRLGCCLRNLPSLQSLELPGNNGSFSSFELFPSGHSRVLRSCQDTIKGKCVLASCGG